MRGPVRIGVLGAGWFASRRHIPDILAHPDAVLAAICRRDPAALSQLAREFHPERSFTSWEEMLDQGRLDAVLICSPNALHYEHARAALERGIHVLLEKPMTLRHAEASELCAIARERGLLLSVALNPPFWAHTHRIRDALQKLVGALEAIGMFWTGNAEYVFGEAERPADLPGVVPPTMYRADPGLCGGGYFMDGGPHLVSEVLWCTGQSPILVTARMDRLPSDRQAAITLQLADGTLASILCIGNSRRGDRRVRNVFAGARGEITVDGFDFRTSIRHDGETETFAESELPRVPGPVEDLVSALLHGTPLASPGEHGAAVTWVLEAAYTSARTGKTIAWHD